MKFHWQEIRFTRHGTRLTTVILQILMLIVRPVLCAGTTLMTTPLTTTAQGFLPDPSLQTETKRNLEVLVHQSIIHTPLQVSHKVEREEDQEFPYLDSYEVEPPETVPNREWKMQKHHTWNEINKSSSYDIPYSMIEHITSTTTESSVKALRKHNYSYLKKYRKSRSTRRLNESSFPMLDNSVLSPNISKLKLIHDLVEHFEKTAKLYSLGLSIFLKRTAPKLCDEKQIVTKENEANTRKRLRTNSLMKTLQQYQSLKKIYFEHVKRVQVIYAPDLFLEKVISSPKPPGLDDGKGVQVMLRKLVKSIERAGSVLKHIDIEVEKLGRYNFFKSNESTRGRPKALERIFAVSDLNLKIPSSKSIVEAIRYSSGKASFLEKVKIVSSLYEHQVLNDIIVDVLHSLLGEVENNKTCSSSETEEEGSCSDSVSTMSAFELRPQLPTSHQEVRDAKRVVPKTDVNEFNISKFSNMVVKKFKELVINQVTQELTSEMKSVFTVPFMVPYAARLTSTTNLTETIIKKVKEIINHLKLPRLFANFRGSWTQNKEFERAIQAAEEAIINAVVPVLLKTGNNLIKRYAITGSNKLKHGARSPIRKNLKVKTTLQSENSRNNPMGFDKDENSSDTIVVSNLLKKMINAGIIDESGEIKMPNQTAKIQELARSVLSDSKIYDKPFE